MREQLRGHSYLFMRLASLDPPGRVRPIPLRLRSLLGLVRNLRAVLGDTDVIYVQSPELALPFVFTPRRSPPYVVHLHGAANPLSVSRYAWARVPLLQHLYSGLTAIALSRAKAVFSVDADGCLVVDSLACRAQKRPCEVMPVGFDQTLFRRISSSDGERDSSAGQSHKLTVLFVGRLEKAKGTGMLLECMDSLNALTPARLIVAGDGSELPVLKRELAGC